MATNNIDTAVAGQAPRISIDLQIQHARLAPDSGEWIDFVFSASPLSGPETGFMLWSEGADGTSHRENEGKDWGNHHTFDFWKKRLWAAQARPHSAQTMRFFASLDYSDERRASNYVDVPLPTLPPPTELSARDGTLKVIIAGRAHPGVSVRCSVGDRSTTVSTGDGRWQAVLEVPKGAHEVQAVVVGPALGESAPTRTQVVVTDPPHIPLRLQYPEENRKIERITRVTGSATPHAEIQASLGGGTATTKANAGGAWEVSRLQSDQSGPLTLLVDNLTTGETVARAVEVDYFPQWDVTHLFAGPIFNESGQVTRAGAVAEGRGEQGDTIQYSVRGEEPWTDLATVGEDLRWRFEHVAPPPPPPPFRLGRLYLRCPGDPLIRDYTVELQPPVITSPEEGAVTGPSVEFSGFAALSFDIELPDGVKQRVTLDKEHAWKVVLGPFAPGIHTVIARSSATNHKREQTRRTFLVEDVPGTDDT